MGSIILFLLLAEVQLHQKQSINPKTEYDEKNIKYRPLTHLICLDLRLCGEGRNCSNKNPNSSRICVFPFLILIHVTPWKRRLIVHSLPLVLPHSPSLCVSIFAFPTMAGDQSSSEQFRIKGPLMPGPGAEEKCVCFMHDSSFFRFLRFMRKLTYDN
jgi:hypothetical protein